MPGIDFRKLHLDWRDRTGGRIDSDFELAGRRLQERGDKFFENFGRRVEFRV